MRFSALAAATLFATAASAQITHIERPDGTGYTLPKDHFSIYSGETIAPGRDAVAFDVGWPGITFGYLHGLTDRTDVRLNVELLYGVENTDTSRFGFGLGAPVRVVLNRTDRITLGAHFDPGFRVYTGSGSSDFLLRVPVGGTLALHVLPELDVSVGVDVPLAVQITHGGQLIIGPLFGASLEYRVDRQLNVGLHTRFGPLYFSGAGGGATSSFGFETLVGVGYRM